MFFYWNLEACKNTCICRVQSPLRTDTGCLEKIIQKIGLTRLALTIAHCWRNFFSIARPNIHSFVFTAASALRPAQPVPIELQFTVSLRRERETQGITGCLGSGKRDDPDIPSRYLHSRPMCIWDKYLLVQGREHEEISSYRVQIHRKFQYLILFF